MQCYIVTVDYVAINQVDTWQGQIWGMEVNCTEYGYYNPKSTMKWVSEKNPYFIIKVNISRLMSWASG